MTERPDRERRSGDVLRGVLYGVGATIVFQGLAILFQLDDVPISLFFIGLTQWIYLLPMIVFFFYMRQRPAVAKGLLIFGGVILLLQGACFGFFLVNGIH